MINYRDMTFCGSYKSCKDRKDCHRKLTKKVRKDAKALGLPIMQYVGEPPCHKLRKKYKGR